MRRPATIATVSRETPTVMSFALDLGGREIGFSAGQWVDLFVTIEGAEAVGGYSITSSPADQTSIRLAVKHDGSDHPVTNWLHDEARAGDAVEVSLGGDFIYTPDEAHSIVLIGGGIGMTPLMSIVRAVDEAGSPHTTEPGVQCIIAGRASVPPGARVYRRTKRQDKVRLHRDSRCA